MLKQGSDTKMNGGVTVTKMRMYISKIESEFKQVKNIKILHEHLRMKSIKLICSVSNLCFTSYQYLESQLPFWTYVCPFLNMIKIFFIKWVCCED